VSIWPNTPRRRSRFRHCQARANWTGKGIAEWLVARLAEDTPILVGIDHGFSFPLRRQLPGVNLDSLQRTIACEFPTK
jgi:hypothetical protein